MLGRARPREVLKPELLPSGTVPSQAPMTGLDWGQQLRGRDKRLQEYGTSSTTVTERVQKRGEKTEVRQHLPGGPEGATKRTREKAPIMH